MFGVGERLHPLRSKRNVYLRVGIGRLLHQAFACKQSRERGATIAAISPHAVRPVLAARLRLCKIDPEALGFSVLRCYSPAWRFARLVKKSTFQRPNCWKSVTAVNKPGRRFATFLPHE